MLGSLPGHHIEADLAIQIILGGLCAAAFALLSFRLRLLTRRGALAQCAAGWMLFGLGTWQWAVPIVVFFAVSSLLSRLTHSASRAGSDLFAKGETRDEAQVAANGGLATLLVLPWFLTGAEVFYVAYLGAVAASAADTWATSIGMTSRDAPHSVRTFQPVVPGQSGGVTPRGVLAASAGAFGIALTGVPWLAIPSTGIVAVTVAAFLASLLDSLLGATLQLQYRCTVCGQLTERRTHCEVLAQRSRGQSWCTNDMVNLLASTAGGAGAMLAYLFGGGAL